MSGAVPWFLLHERRRLLLSRLLQALVGSAGPLQEHPHLCMALLLLEAVDAVPEHLDPKQQGQAQEQQRWAQLLPWWQQQLQQLPQAERAREAAKGLLAKQRNNLAMWGALARLEVAAGQTKAARRIFDMALQAACALPSELQRQAVLPQLALQYANAELELGSAGATSGKVAVQRAHHVLQWLLQVSFGSSTGAPGSTVSSTAAAGDQAQAGVAVPFTPYSAAASGQLPASLTDDAVTAARCGFGASVPWLMTSLQAGTAAATAAAGAAAAVAAAALFEVLTERQQQAPAGTGGLRAALAAFKNVTGSVPAAARASSGIHEWLQTFVCRLMVHEQQQQQARLAAPTSSGGLTPSQLRAHLLSAMVLYPSNESLIALMEVSERSAHAYVRLRQLLTSAAELRPTPVLLAAAVRADVGRLMEVLPAAGAPAGAWKAPGSSSRGVPGARMAAMRVAPLLEKAAAAGKLAACPMLWHMYLRFEVGQGRMDAARRVFLRAIRECPAAKTLWMEGLQALQQALPPREVSELISIAGDKGVRLRTEVMEVMLEALAEGEAGG